MKVALLNTTIVTTDGVYEVETISLDEAKALVQGVELDSAVGHAATAGVMTQLLGVEVATNRQEFSQQVGQVALAFKLNGRIPEGTVLTAEQIEEMGYTFKTMTRKS